ncbi:unnamed protein product, partial [marine sediment metagenome]
LYICVNIAKVYCLRGNQNESNGSTWKSKKKPEF